MDTARRLRVRIKDSLLPIKLQLPSTNTESNITPAKDPDETQSNPSTTTTPLFFSKLPLEIRERIYNYALRIDALVFDAVTTGPAVRLFTDRFSKHVLSFPKTCRRAYADSIEYIYKHNVFRFHYDPALLILSTKLSPRLFNSIRTVKFLLNIEPIDNFVFRFRPESEEIKIQWAEFWHPLTKMESLRFVWIWLHYGHHLGAYRGGSPTDAKLQKLEERYLSGFPELPHVEIYEVNALWFLNHAPLGGEHRRREWPFRLRCVEWDVSEPYRDVFTLRSHWDD